VPRIFSMLSQACSDRALDFSAYFCFRSSSLGREQPCHGCTTWGRPPGCKSHTPRERCLPRSTKWLTVRCIRCAWAAASGSACGPEFSGTPAAEVDAGSPGGKPHAHTNCHQTLLGLRSVAQRWRDLVLWFAFPTVIRTCFECQSSNSNSLGLRRPGVCVGTNFENISYSFASLPLFVQNDIGRLKMVVCSCFVWPHMLFFSHLYGCPPPVCQCTIISSYTTQLGLPEQNTHSMTHACLVFDCEDRSSMLRCDVVVQGPTADD
jgi:hypothetical protein